VWKFEKFPSFIIGKYSGGSQIIDWAVRASGGRRFAVVSALQQW